MEHSQDLINDGGFSHGDNYRRYDDSSIGPVADHMFVYVNSHAPYEQHSQSVSSPTDSFSTMDNDDALSTGVGSVVSEHNPGYLSGRTSDVVRIGVDSGISEHGISEHDSVNLSGETFWRIMKKQGLHIREQETFLNTKHTI